MKDLFKAWRWSNLLNFSCWKYGIKSSFFLFTVAIFILACIFRTDQDSMFFIYLFAIAAIFLLMSFVCCGIDRFIVSTNWSYIRVFVYPYSDSKCKMIIKDRYSIKEIYIEEYERPNGRVVPYFIYMKERGEWLFMTANNHKKFGKKLSDNVFLSKTADGDKAIINIVGKKQEYSYICDFFVYNDFYRPKNKLKDKQTSPDEYLLIRNADKYQMLGIYLNADEVHEVHPPVIIYEELGDIVILTYNALHKKYVQTHRKEVALYDKIRINKLKDYVVGGQIFVFDQETQSYQKDYEGRIFGINTTNNSLIGENDWTIKLQEN